MKIKKQHTLSWRKTPIDKVGYLCGIVRRQRLIHLFLLEFFRLFASTLDECDLRATDQLGGTNPNC